MTWEDLLFAHWPVPEDSLRSLIPEGLELETFDGSAWIGIVPFRMTGVGLRWLPPIQGTAAFPELNVRTYVSAGGKPGVWFFSLDAASPMAVRAARRSFHLPYFDAEMYTETGEKVIAYRSRRIHRGAPVAEFDATYGPVGPVDFSAPGTLEHFFTARFCLYAGDIPGSKQRRLWRGEIHHPPWPLQAAQANFAINTMTTQIGLELPATEAVLHFARRLDVVAWAPRRL